MFLVSMSEPVGMVGKPKIHWCFLSPSKSMVSGFVADALVTLPSPERGRDPDTIDYSLFRLEPVPAALGRRPQMSKQAKTTAALPVLHPHAAGIDIGATAIYVGVPEDRATPCVRRFETFTADLLAAADWLEHCGVKTIAIESTGVYWIALFQILEERGFEVCLVNARHLKNVPGHKSDVEDCQWLQYVHACGLLRASFRPDEQICAVRSLLRHRETLVAYAASHVQQMQKALTQMNLLLHNVISDLTGKTGLAILDAILSGERDTAKLAALKDPRIQASPQTIAKSLQGYYRPEHLFPLKQALAAYRHYQQLLSECDQELEKLLRSEERR